jgi:outer membrane cobalamin receptor
MHARASWGKGFKLPSFYALGQPLIGNSLLRPEHSDGFDVGLEQTLARKRVQLTLTYFHNSLHDLIDFSPQLFKLVNRTLVNTKGFELGTKFDVNRRIGIGIHATYLQWALRNTVEPLRDQPRWQGGGNLEWKISERMSSEIETLAVGKRFDFQIPVPEKNVAAGYSTTNIVLNCDVTRHVAVHFRAENILNRTYEEFVGFPSPGTYLRFGMTYRFSAPRDRVHPKRLLR